jgi:hypothetical protein
MRIKESGRIVGFNSAIRNVYRAELCTEPVEVHCTDPAKRDEVSRYLLSAIRNSSGGGKYFPGSEEKNFRKPNRENSI